jgi:hypothetical protein
MGSAGQCNETVNSSARLTRPAQGLIVGQDARNVRWDVIHFYADLILMIGNIPASATVTVSNAGNIPAAGPLEVALSARPEGTAGSADIALQTVTVKISIKPSGSGRERLSFLVPSTLAAGSYSLVAQIDPNNAFNETSLPSAIVSLETFTVS